MLGLQFDDDAIPSTRKDKVPQNNSVKMKKEKTDDSNLSLEISTY